MSEKTLKYESIAYDLRKKILNGTYKQNDQLPLEKEMCAYYSTSRITVKKAVDLLVAEGLVIKRRGAGTFVKDIENPNSEAMQTSQFMGFSEVNKYKKVSSDILEFRINNPSEKIAQKLRITPNDFVYKIVRIRNIDQVPHVLQESYMPINLIQGLRIDNVVDSVYTFIESVLHFSIQSAHRTIRAAMPTEEERELLKMNNQEALLVIEQIAYFDDGQPFEYSISKYNSDKFEFHTIDMR